MEYRKNLPWSYRTVWWCRNRRMFPGLSNFKRCSLSMLLFAKCKIWRLIRKSCVSSRGCNVTPESFNIHPELFNDTYCTVIHVACLISWIVTQTCILPSQPTPVTLPENLISLLQPLYDTNSKAPSERQHTVLSRTTECETTYVRVGLVTGCIGQLQLLITIHYGAIDNSHIRQFITSRTESSRSIISSSVL